MTGNNTFIQGEVPLVASRPKYDDLPEPLEDIDCWLINYKLRLNHVVFAGRNGARDKALLTTLVFSMERQCVQVFGASVRWLVIHSAMYDQSVQKALHSLREGGYIRRHPTDGSDEGTKADTSSEYTKDGQRRPYAYSLVADALPLAPEGARMPGTDLKKAVEGDYEDPAFAGHRGFNARRRALYLWARQNEGSTIYAAAKALKMAYNTIKNHAQWLDNNQLARIGEDGTIKAFPGGREKYTLSTIADRNHLHEKTKRRIEFCEKGWAQVKAERNAKRTSQERAIFYAKMVSGVEERETSLVNLGFDSLLVVNSQGFA